ncbi:hypothetical protein C2G38_2189206 [Gigaspora rosea]|uniref:Uncharacterized protein n=1 Tax=Gigaspora rosea TaxID=44941 RepID=A0A397V2F7_9GLOM|nr:hypothetical protein C2G38_2189206 [Gigaspora rosea]
MTKEQTSRNKDIDDYIKEIQFKATEYGLLDNIQKTSESESGSSFLATWLDDIIIMDYAEVVTGQKPQQHGAKPTEYDNVIE